MNLDIRLAGGETLLIRAAELSQQAVVEQLLAVGLYPNRAAANGETALIRAAEAGHRDLVAYLLPFQTDNGAGTLFWAGSHGRRVIDTAKRALRFAINRIEDPQAKREAIQARQTLYRDGVKEYRAQRREAERRWRQGAERGDGAGRDR